MHYPTKNNILYNIKRVKKPPLSVQIMETWRGLSEHIKLIVRRNLEIPLNSAMTFFFIEKRTNEKLTESVKNKDKRLVCVANRFIGNIEKHCAE